MIKNRIKELRLVEWRNIKDLQPKNIKQIFNYSHIENSILQHGFAFPFGVWIDKNGDVYAIDGHTRIEVLSNMEGVPEMLPAFVIDVKDKKEAIKILLEVYNQRTNPIDEDVMREWLEVEEIAIQEIKVESLNVFGMGAGGGGTDYYDVIDKAGGQDASSPKSSDDGYSVFELIMLHENKLELLETINQVKRNFSFEKQEDAIMEILRQFNNIKQ